MRWDKLDLTAEELTTLYQMIFDEYELREKRVLLSLHT
eukprot:SAG31_NODE_44127_length_264_cov_0.630303_1_plen_37_part_10